MGTPIERSSISVAELIAVMSLGVDLGLGQPMEHVLRQCVLVLELASRAGMDESEREVAYFVSLLAWVGCISDSHEQARWFGDDIELRAGFNQADMTPGVEARYVMGRIGSGSPPVTRARTVAKFMTSGRREVDGMRGRHCIVAGDLAVQLGLSAEVGANLRQVYERWDGKGQPGEVSADEISLPVRLVQLADVVECFDRVGGAESAVKVARERRGTQFAPDAVDIFCDHATDVLGMLAEQPTWDYVIADQPYARHKLSGDELSAALEAIADFTDLKSPYTLGHSRAVADLAAEAGRVQGLTDEDVTLLRMAGLMHDLGRLGVSNAIWDKKAPLTAGDRERIRMAPYLTERMLKTSPVLSPLGALAGAHYERLDGSGYPRGLTGDAMSQAARTLAAADVYRALLEPRPHREAMSPETAATELRAETRANRLDGNAVEAVLRAAGHKACKRPEQPAGLTPREIEVLRLLARGMRDKEIGQALHITPKTVGHHVTHIYLKIGASNRVAASVFATEHGLLGA